MLLDVRGVCIELAGKSIIGDMSFGLRSGEFTVILGPNGAGKSTLLKALAGEFCLTRGEALFNGRHLNEWRPFELARSRAVMPQRVEVNFPLTAWEVIALGRPARSARAADPVIDELIELLDVQALANRSMPTLSGGEQQRVQLARVLAQIWDSPAPRLLLLDECTSALDPAHQQMVFRLLKELAHEQGFGVLAVAHDLNLAAQHGDSLILLRSGSMHSQGCPQRVLTETALWEVYGLAARVTHLPEGFPMVISSGRIGSQLKTAV